MESPRTVNVFDGRVYSGQFMPLARARGVEFKYGAALLAGYAEELQSEGIAVGIHVLGALVSGKPRRRCVTVGGDWQFQRGQIRGGLEREVEGLERACWCYADGKDGNHQAINLHDRSDLFAN